MMKILWRAVASFFTYWALRLHFYKLKSDLHRWMWERQYKDVKVSTFSTLGELATTMAKTKYQPDGWRELFDAVSSPGRCERIFSGAEVATHGVDCDEFALYITAAATKSLAAGTLLDTVWCPRFFTVTWFEGWKAMGHNVCLFTIPPIAPVLAVRYAYMDYGRPSAPFETIQQVADSVRRRYATRGADLAPLVWCVSALDLTPENVCRG